MYVFRSDFFINFENNISTHSYKDLQLENELFKWSSIFISVKIQQALVRLTKFTTFILH